MGYKSYALMAILLASLVTVGLAGAAYAQAAGLTVKTDSSEYATGDNIIVSGTVGAIKAGQPVLIQVLDPTNNVDRVDQITVMADGTYSYTLRAGGIMNTSGTYTVVVTYDGSSKETTFEFTATGKPTANTVPLTIDGKTYDIEYSISGGSLKSLTADVDLATLTAQITSTADGNLTLKLPRDVIQALSVDGPTGGTDVEYAAFADQVPTTLDETATTSEYRTISVMFEMGTSEIDIVGTWIVPEFGTIAVIVLAVSIVGIVAAARYNKFSFMPKFG
jgi:predicted secreted protein with PEFG-CTERM motif